VGLLFTLVAFAGTISAYTPLTARPIADIVLAGLWLGVVFGWIARRELPRRSGAVLVLVALLIGVTLLAVPFSDPLSRGLESVRLSVWPLSALLLIATSPWARPGRGRILEIALAVAAVALAYSAIRHLSGASGLEEEVARAALPGVPDDLQLRFYGSMPTAQQLAIFAATSLPLALAAALASEGRRRIVFAAIAAIAVFVVIATEIRTGTIAAVAATLVAVGLFSASSSFPRPERRRAAMLALAGVALVGVGSYLAVVANEDDRAERFAGLLDPGADESFSVRLDRWEEAVPIVFDRPLGAGLATSGVLAAEKPAEAVAEPNLDNDYLKVGIEQGPFPMLLLILTFGALGIALARCAVRGGVESAPLAAGACGAVVALATMAITAFAIEQLQALPVWMLVGLALAGADRDHR